MNKVDLEKHSDEKLVQISIHDIVAFEILIKRYQKKIYHYINRLVNFHNDDAEDIAQDTFIKVYKNLAKFNPKLKFSSWLYRIAHNEAINFIKKNKIRQTISIEDNQYLINTLQSSDNVLQNLQNKQNEDLVIKLLSRMRVKDRIPLVLYFFEHKSYLEIADILHISQNSVGSLIKRAKKKFKHIYKKDENAKPKFFKRRHKSN